MFKKLIAESTAKSPWLFHINAGSCNGCDIELVSVLTPRYDAERLGFKLAGTPRHADIVVVTGPVTKQSLPRVLRAISQVPEPRCIVTMGSCPQSGNVFRGSYSVAGPLSSMSMSMLTSRDAPRSPRRSSTDSLLRPKFSRKRGSRNNGLSVCKRSHKPAFQQTELRDVSRRTQRGRAQLSRQNSLSRRQVHCLRYV